MRRRDLVRTFLATGLGTALLPTGAIARSSIVVPRRSHGTLLPRPVAVDPTMMNARPSDDVWICWIGHATVLMHVFGTWVLTDPVLLDTYGITVLGLTIGPRRLRPPALAVDDMPKPDLILLSHAHMDHMDRPTLSKLAERFPGEVDVVTAAKTSDVIADLPWRSLQEMDWGDRATVHGIDLRAHRVRHNGWRLPGDPCRANGQPRSGRSYNGYVLERNGFRIVFGGDTAYTDTFRDIGGGVDVAIMPIGAYNPYPDTHCTPEECLAMVDMMRARTMIPIHHSTFCQSEEPMPEPLQRLRAAVPSSSTTLAMQAIGEAFSYARS